MTMRKDKPHDRDAGPPMPHKAEGKNITCRWGDLVNGCPHLVIAKEKGALSRDEIEDAARRFSPGKYLLIVDARMEGIFDRLGAGHYGDTAHLLDMEHVTSALAEICFRAYREEEEKRK